jgi:hypothetical protein
MEAMSGGGDKRLVGELKRLDYSSYSVLGR